ncbi:S8 family serine peptidase [Streptomyces sp. NPDC004539]|uniref:S8 family peptidase n=1 Tax=Streptomyces sp. NPDC004539 TaxID=3154280 RepID=UPI0033A04BEF
MTALTGVALGTPSQAASNAGGSAVSGGSGSSGGSLGFGGEKRVTLITGDRVVVDGEGRVRAVERAEGREGVPFQIREIKGRTLVVPADAAAMIAAGKVDRRLFDIAELSKPAQRGGLNVIVSYQGKAPTARADVRDAATVRRSLKSLDAEAVLTDRQEPGKLWDAVTDGNRTTKGVANVWLDGVRTASLDKSVPQIGAPAVWASGYTGKGVKIAVLDTGVDATHPDLKGQVSASKNFSPSPDARDRQGHGTHVASTAAGTGAKSNGKYKGVAPGATILNGKVLGDDGSGYESGILAGMEWAAAQGADIVNLSLGGTDTPDVDPLEEAVNRLSEQKNILFAIAAGNEGEDGEETVGSPGSAANALTVGAVDGADKLAKFSSRGPTADGSVKPDVTAPGVDITAASAPGSAIAREVGESPAGYLTISGTSMATPHVAGAAALLKQQHPDWSWADLKSALMGSAKPGAGLTPNQQGSGRIAVDLAAKQTVLADTPALNFGVQQWPHTDDTPVTRKLTYRNSGAADVVLKLTGSAVGPNSRTAPAGFLTLGASEVTVPAGGSASVDVTLDTRLGGTLDGTWSGNVVANGGGQNVRSTLSVLREVQSYDVTVTYVNRAGQSPVHLTSLSGYSGLGDAREYASQSTANTVKLRVRKGKYLLDSLSAKSLTSEAGGVDWVVQPVLDVSKDTAVTLDLTKTKASDITVPDKTAKQVQGSVSYAYDAGFADVGMDVSSLANLRMAHVGPAVASGLSQTWFGQWQKGAGAEYDILTSRKVTRVGALTKHYKATELATVRAGLGSSSKNRTGAVGLFGELASDGFGTNSPQPQRLPGTRTLYLSTGEGARWTLFYGQFAPKPDAAGDPVIEAEYAVDDSRAYAAGKTYAETFNTPVAAPRVNGGDFGISRQGNEIYGSLPLFADGAGHAGTSLYGSATTTLYRNGKKVGSHDDPLLGLKAFTVPAANASYRLTTSVTRPASLFPTSTRIDASWTFSSKSAPQGARLPSSALRIPAPTDLAGLAPAGRKVTVPVTVLGSAAGKNLKSLAVSVSYDGKKWTKVSVVKGKITYKNPARGKAVSFRYTITDKKGNVSSVSIWNAYLGK